MKEYQLELFYDREKKKDELRKRRHVLVVPLDVVILVNIVAVFSIAVAFSLGVEKGKKIALQHNKKSNITLPVAESNENATMEKAVVTKEIPTRLTEKLKAKKEEEYIIQVASYLKEDIAHKEKEYLKKEGFSAQLSKKGKYIVLFVGKFLSKKEAERIKTLLKKRYGDCFIRRM